MNTVALAASLHLAMDRRLMALRRDHRDIKQVDPDLAEDGCAVLHCYLTNGDYFLVHSQQKLDANGFDADSLRENVLRSFGDTRH
jgi:hypothetical protein